MVAQIVNAFQAVQESHQRKDKRMSMAQLENCLQDTDMITSQFVIFL